jgi:hypothetical protein
MIYFCVLVKPVTPRPGKPLATEVRGSYDPRCPDPAFIDDLARASFSEAPPEHTWQRATDSSRDAHRNGVKAVLARLDKMMAAKGEPVDKGGS